GFEIQEAAPQRQWGHIAIAVTGEWRIDWKDRQRVRQVADLPTSLQHEGVIAGFEYLSQPASLIGRIVPRPTRISVEPQYAYFVETHQIRLEAHLKYKIRGAKTSVLQVALPDWEIDDVGPVDLVDPGLTLATHAPLLTVPLKQPTSGEVELVI